MNFLAHLYLSGDDPDILVGNMMGDFLKGIGASGFPAAVQEGIRLHRSIDTFTDTHAVFARSRGRFEPPYRRYAGVLVDVFYDHFLAAHWSAYSPHESLASFATRGGIDLTLKRMSRRPKRANPLAEAGGQLVLHGSGLESDFAEFFPDLIEYARQQGVLGGIKAVRAPIPEEVCP